MFIVVAGKEHAEGEKQGVTVLPEWSVSLSACCEQAGPDNSAAAGKTPLVSSMVLPERPGSFPPLVIWIFGMLLLSGGINSRGDVWL